MQGNHTARRVRFATVCSGIEAPSVALGAHGWDAEWFSEIEPFPSALLAYRYPSVPNLGDMTLLPEKVLAREASAPEVLIGGTPCQSFSVAGFRHGLSDERGQLTIKFVELANAIDQVRETDNTPPSVIWWENVPGVLSDKQNAFGCFLAALVGEDEPLEPPRRKWEDAGVVYGPQRAAAWRVLDAQYLGVAQRRRRVFVVASARDGFDPGAVLFEFYGMRRDTAPSREQGEGTASSPREGFVASGHRQYCGGVGTLRASGGETPAVERVFYDAYQHHNWRESSVSGTLTANLKRGICGDSPLVWEPQATGVFCSTQNDALRDVSKEIAPTLRAGSGGGTIQQVVGPLTNGKVRRLTPVECERLQGFPDNYTQIPWRDRPAEDCPDGHRYKSLGNSMAVPCMRWIGIRIQQHLAEADEMAEHDYWAQSLF